jgi:5-methylcytosine-specific restriction endonuclease McrA
MKKCELCGKEFKVIDKGHTRKYCYECSPYYHKGNKKEYVYRQIEFRRAMKRYGIEYLGGKCQRCGYNKCAGALSFHHKNPASKEYNFNDSTMSINTYKKELDKCNLLCMNCHMEEHWNESSRNK